MLVGRVTDEREHPQLTVRHWQGQSPRRLVIDHLHPLNMESLFAHGVQSLIVEGGAKTLMSFLEDGLWDELRVETNLGLTVSDGTHAPQLPADAIFSRREQYGDNQIMWFVNKT